MSTTENRIKIAILGAGGKMGGRLCRRLIDDAEIEILAVEASDSARLRLAEAGIQTTAPDDAWGQADVVILAIPDALIGRVAAQVVPKLRSGALVVGLDPAAAFAGRFPERADVAYFVAHPCHPPLFESEHIGDWFGGEALPQSVVCALVQGSEADYARGEWIAVKMFSPILRVHRITLEQMAVLEPGLVETGYLTFIIAMREALDEIVRRGVPKEAAWDFALGHIRTELAIVFGFAEFPVSEGAKAAVEHAKPLLFHPDWLENALGTESVRRQVAAIVGPEE